MNQLSNEALDAAHAAFMAHGNAQSFLNHPTRKFICNECGAECAEFVDLQRHRAFEAIMASMFPGVRNPGGTANPAGSVGS